MAADLDVLIIGAGISGIGAAYYLQRDHPNKTYALLEARDAIGGTWDLFRYPGIRSDSDIQTFGYEFKPWTGEDDTFASLARKFLPEETALRWKPGPCSTSTPAIFSAPSTCFLARATRPPGRCRCNIIPTWPFFATDR